MVCDPAVSVDIAKVATPDPFKVTEPRVVDPSLNVTVPEGVPAPGAVALTVAVKVTDWPGDDGFNDEVIAVDEADWLPACVSATEVFVVKFVSPL